MSVTSQGIHTIPRRLSVLAAAVLVAAASVFFTASPASAHDRLLGSDPAAGATVEQLPEVMTLTFSAAIAPDAGASEILVTDAAGESLADGEPTVDGPVLSQALGDVTAGGAVTVLWKVVSSDGHPISGEYTFSVTSAPTPTPTPTETTAPTAEPSASAMPVAPVETATPEPGDTAPAGDSSEFVPWIIVAVLGALVIAASAYLIVSRTRRRNSSSQTPPADSDTPSER